MSDNFAKTSVYLYFLPKNWKLLCGLMSFFVLALLFSSCKKEGEDPGTQPGGRETVLAITPSGSNEIAGSVKIEENPDSSFNIVINLTKTPMDTVYIDMHNRDFVDPFQKAAMDFGYIVGTGGPASITKSNISRISLPDESRTDITYDGILVYHAFINFSSSHTAHNTSTAIAHVDL